MPEAFPYKPPMTALMSSIKHENHDVIFIGKRQLQIFLLPTFCYTMMGMGAFR